MRLTARHHNIPSEPGSMEREECRVCQDVLYYVTDSIGYLHARCPHCDDKQPHSRPAYVARAAVEAASVKTLYGDIDAGVLRNCARCSTPFVARTKTTLYCSLTCRFPVRPPAPRKPKPVRPTGRICAATDCSVLIPDSARLNMKYCSLECRYRTNKRRYDGTNDKPRPDRRATPSILSCARPGCDTTFVPHAYQQRFCSPACQLKVSNANGTARRRAEREVRRRVEGLDAALRPRVHPEVPQAHAAVAPDGNAGGLSPSSPSVPAGARAGTCNVAGVVRPVVPAVAGAGESQPCGGVAGVCGECGDTGCRGLQSQLSREAA